ncbi:MAG: hypothetical protein JW866_09965, partial [Ignavibacteriales bacterium]|nr:hypothetical protein [Ignavibacteriales bacterium]
MRSLYITLLFCTLLYSNLLPAQKQSDKFVTIPLEEHWHHRGQRQIGLGLASWNTYYYKTISGNVVKDDPASVNIPLMCFQGQATNGKLFASFDYLGIPFRYKGECYNELRLYFAYGFALNDAIE